MLHDDKIEASGAKASDGVWRCMLSDKSSTTEYRDRWYQHAPRLRPLLTYWQPTYYLCAGPNCTAKGVVGWFSRS